MGQFVTSCSGHQGGAAACWRTRAPWGFHPRPLGALDIVDTHDQIVHMRPLKTLCRKATHPVTQRAEVSRMWRDGGNGERLRPANVPQTLYLTSFAFCGKREPRKAVRHPALEGRTRVSRKRSRRRSSRSGSSEIAKVRKTGPRTRGQVVRPDGPSPRRRAYAVSGRRVPGNERAACQFWPSCRKTRRHEPTARLSPRSGQSGREPSDRRDPRRPGAPAPGTLEQGTRGLPTVPGCRKVGGPTRSG